MKQKIMIILPIILVVIIGMYFFMDKEIQVQKELEINKSIDDVWEVMGKQYGQVHLWSTNFKDSKPGGISKFQGLNYSERITQTGRGETVQSLDSFDSGAHAFSYHITKGAPSIAKKASAIWALKSDGSDKTTAVFIFNMETKGFLGFLMKPLIKRGMGKSALEIGEDLKYYVENGSPHPRKIKSMEK